MSRGRGERVEIEVREYLLEKEGCLVIEMGWEDRMREGSEM